jgi:hypothetical protein
VRVKVTERDVAKYLGSTTLVGQMERARGLAELLGVEYAPEPRPKPALPGWFGGPVNVTIEDSIVAVSCGEGNRRGLVVTSYEGGTRVLVDKVLLPLVEAYERWRLMLEALEDAHAAGPPIETRSRGCAVALRIGRGDAAGGAS